MKEEANLMRNNWELRQNLAVWDRGIRAVAAAFLVLGSPMVVQGGLWLTIVGAVGGMQLFASITGY